MSQLYVHAFIRGTVQGVGFRAIVKRHAERLGIAGTVKNLPDGSVELHAQGPEEKLSQLFLMLEQLDHDDHPARVKEIATRYSKPVKPVTGFTIL